MYLTFFIKNPYQRISFEELLRNPYLEPTNSKYQPGKKKTVEVTDEYGKALFDKKQLNPKPDLLDKINIPAEEISSHYKEGYLPKRSDPNKKRKIYAPDPEISTALNIIKDHIENYYMVQPHDAAFAYTANRSALKAQERHQVNKSKWSLKIDLEDFYPSINKEYLSKTLLSIFPFKFMDPEIFEKIVDLALINDEVPQGSPLSPLISNLAMIPIDHVLAETLMNYKHHHYVYTRYADDIKISCKEKFDPQEILNLIQETFDKFQAPFKFNYNKVHFTSVAGKNYYLGINQNSKNELSLGYKKNNAFKAMIFNFAKDYKDGTPIEINTAEKLIGKINYYKEIEPDFTAKTLEKYHRKFGIDIVKAAKDIIRGLY